MRHWLQIAHGMVWHAVVTVLSPEFVRMRNTMGKLHAALARQEGGPEQQQRQLLCPIFYSVGKEECSRSDFREQYDIHPWESFELEEPKPEPGVLDDYAKDIAELCTLMGLPEAQVCVSLQYTLQTWDRVGLLLRYMSVSPYGLTH